MIILCRRRNTGYPVGSPDINRRSEGEALMDAVLQLSSTVGIESACDALGVARATFYRRRPLLGPPLSVMLPVPVRCLVSARALSSGERKSVRAGDWGEIVDPFGHHWGI